MAKVVPFKALRFTNKAGDIGELVCPPYDIISEQQRKQYIARNQHNIIRLELPKDGENPYQTAGNTLKDWLNSGILCADSKDAFYIYEEEFSALGQTHKVKGFVSRVRLEEFASGVVLPHEETLSKAKADRFDLMKASNCNFSSIYSLYFDENAEVYSIIDRLSSGKADVEFAADDGVIQRLWIITNADDLALSNITALMATKKLYIADGHHRYETALNYKRHLESQGNTIDDAHPANYIMMTLVNIEHKGLVVFPTHRIVRELASFNLDAILEKSAQYFDIADCDLASLEARLGDAAKDGRKAFGLYTKGKVVLMTLKDIAVMDSLLPDKSSAYKALDVSVLHTLVLERLLGIDKENMANQKNLIYTRDISEAIAEVDSGSANCAFIINPTRVDEIAAVASAAEKMPQKSTYFYPKIITGLVMNILE